MDDIRNPYCPNCQKHFVMTEASSDGYERSGETFYCPQGHSLVIRQNDIVSQLRTSERHLLRSEEQVKLLYKKVESFKGVIKRQRNRLTRGCCPYCNKNVLQITESHMLKHIRERHSK